MPRKMGEALKAIVGEGTDKKAEEKKGPVSVLMNENRLRIFQFLCLFPCSYQRRISEGLNLSYPTVAWHLQKLREAGYVQEKVLGGRRVYVPPGMVCEDALQVLALLNKPGYSALFLIAAKEPGLSAGDISSSVHLGKENCRNRLRELEKVRLISSITDGKYRRYFPTDKLEELSKKNRKSLRQFKKMLRKMLEQDRLSPQVTLSRSREAEISFRIGRRSRRLFIPADPFSSILGLEAKEVIGFLET